MRSGAPAITSRACRPERGAALIVAMLFLVILAMLGIASISGTTQEEKMAGNSRNMNIALQAAEAAMRDAEQDLLYTGASTSPQRKLDVTSFATVCPNNSATTTLVGLCSQQQTTPPCSNATNGSAPTTNLDPTLNPLRSAFYGQFTNGGAAPLQGVSQQPRYMIELLCATPPTAGNRWFRITAIGYGQNPNTSVILQSVYEMTFP